MLVQIKSGLFIISITTVIVLVAIAPRFFALLLQPVDYIAKWFIWHSLSDEL